MGKHFGSAASVPLAPSLSMVSEHFPGQAIISSQVAGTELLIPTDELIMGEKLLLIADELDGEESGVHVCIHACCCSGGLFMQELQRAPVNSRPPRPFMSVIAAMRTKPIKMEIATMCFSVMCAMAECHECERDILWVLEKSS